MSRFSHPWILLFIPIIIGYGIYLAKKTKASVIFSNAGLFGKVITFRTFLKGLIPWFYILTIIVAIFGIAEPLGKPIILNRDEMGIDIIIALDLSTSMEAPDFEPSRFDAAIDIAEDFINSRENDRIGLVVFALDAYLLSPPTLNHQYLLSMLDDLELGSIEDGTAIGMGLAIAANGLRDAQGESKVIILLTDGVNNSGAVDPISAAQAAKTLDMKIYTIGIGSETPMNYHSSRYGYISASTADYALLEQIASSPQTSFKATDPNTLKKAFKLIDQMEKTEQQLNQLSLRPSHAHFWVGLCLVLFLSAFIAERTFLRSLP
ncbi:MAG: VWA domain-containing protein [bacterium]